MKIKMPVYIKTMASKHIGHVEVESKDDYIDAAYELWDETGDYISVNSSNDFEIGESELDESVEEDFEYFKNTKGA